MGQRDQTHNPAADEGFQVDLCMRNYQISAMRLSMQIQSEIFVGLRTIIALALCTLMHGNAVSQEEGLVSVDRSWTSANGSSIEGRLVYSRDGTVDILSRENISGEETSPMTFYVQWKGQLMSNRLQIEVKIEDAN